MVKKDGTYLKYVPNHFKDEELCDIAFDNTCTSIEYIPPNLHIKY